MSKKGTVKLSLHVSPEANELIEEISEAGHMSKSDVLRKSIALMKIAVDVKNEGKKLGILDKNRHVISEITGI